MNIEIKFMFTNNDAFIIDRIRYVKTVDRQLLIIVVYLSNTIMGF